MKNFRPEHFINRELSWLAFNSRVLAEAESASVPLMERVKFLAIVASNLDEFFMVRAAQIRRRLGTGWSGPDGIPPGKLIRAISQQAHQMERKQYRCLTREILPSLRKKGIEIVRADDLKTDDRTFVEEYFQEQVLPVLTPMVVDTSHPFPLLTTGAVYILFKVSALEEGVFYGKADTILVQLPAGIRRFVVLPEKNERTRLALLDDIVCLFADSLMRGYAVNGAWPFRVTRDAEYSVDEETIDDLMTALERELRTRRWGAPVRLEVGREMPKDILAYLQKEMKLSDYEIYNCAGMLDLRCLFAMPQIVGRPQLSNPEWTPQPHPRLMGERNLLKVIRKGDLILHHPYQSFDPVVELIDTAADDPDVLAIKITLYRVSGDSPIVNALVRAAENGKQVTALVELRARFDEEANISWAKRLDSSGAHVIYGVVGYKTHSKVLLIVRREKDGIRRYVHLSTGNYNDRTARVYTDIGYFTANPAFGIDVSHFFNVITGYSLPPTWNHIEMSPTGMRQKLLALLEREIEKHTPETPGFIRAKMNSLIDPEIIELLYRASRKGVTIDLVVRGLCRLRPGVKRLSENITVRSIVDRFLEHSRIFHFHNGGNEEVYLSSADWMERNMDQRLELLFPVLDERLQSEVVMIIDAALKDNVKAWQMRPDGSYYRRSGRESFRSQRFLFEDACEMARQHVTSSRHKVFRPRTRPVD